MHPLPHDWLALALIVFLLGVKHGLDPDHLATIDGLTRYNAASRPRLARWSGCLFSLGHGAVVTSVAIAIALWAEHWAVPGWLEDLGAWISILFLFGLGFMNLLAVFTAPRNEVLRSVGLKSRWLGRFAEASHPLLIASVGALFALSFDTLSQAALFSITASSIAGWTFSGLLGFVFMLGMMATDSVNGLWIAKLLRAADARAIIASRVMGLSIAGLSLLIGSYGLAKQLSPQFAEQTDDAVLLSGLGVVAVITLSFLLALWMSQQAPHAKTAQK